MFQLTGLPATGLAPERSKGLLEPPFGVPERSKGLLQLQLGATGVLEGAAQACSVHHVRALRVIERSR